MIEGDLALNDTGFKLVQAMCPYVQFESVGDFILEPRWSKFVVGLQTEGRKMGVQGPRATGAPTCAKYSSECFVF